MGGKSSYSSRFSDRYFEGTRLGSLDRGAPGSGACGDLDRVGEEGEMMEVVAFRNVVDKDGRMSGLISTSRWDIMDVPSR